MRLWVDLGAAGGRIDGTHPHSLLCAIRPGWTVLRVRIRIRVRVRVRVRDRVRVRVRVRARVRVRVRVRVSNTDGVTVRGYKWGQGQRGACVLFMCCA